MTSSKQVIVLRKDLNMRKGKMVAQGSHASLSAYISATTAYPKHVESIAKEWFMHGQTKICVGVETEDELLKLWQLASSTADLPCYLVRDAGLTEFKAPTYTALAIGPATAEKVDKITGLLKLL